MAANGTHVLDGARAILRRAWRSRVGGALAAANALGLALVLWGSSVAECDHAACAAVQWARYSLVGPVRSPLAMLLLLANAPVWAAMYVAEWLAQPWWGSLCAARAIALERAFLVFAGAAHAQVSGHLLEAWWTRRRAAVGEPNSPEPPHRGEAAPPAAGTTVAKPARRTVVRTAAPRRRTSAARSAPAPAASGREVFRRWSVEAPSSGPGHWYRNAAFALVGLWLWSAFRGSDACLLLAVLSVPFGLSGAAICVRTWLEDEDVSEALLGTALGALPAATTALAIATWNGCGG